MTEKEKQLHIVRKKQIYSLGLVVIFFICVIVASLKHRVEHLAIGTPRTSLEVEKEWNKENKVFPPGATKKININFAQEHELCALNGIGTVVSQKIIEYREQINGFHSIEEIMGVQGIGEKKFEEIKPYITVE